MTNPEWLNDSILALANKIRLANHTDCSRNLIPNLKLNMKTKKNSLYRACASALAIGAAAIALLPTGTRAQTNIWHDDFDQQSVGANSTDATYGRIAYNYGGSPGANPFVIITNNSNPDTLPVTPGFTHSNYCAFIFTCSANVYNFGWDINSVATTGGNTNTSIYAYTLSYDIAVQGDGFSNFGAYVSLLNYVFGHDTPGSWTSGEYYGNGAQTNFAPVGSAAFLPTPGTGWVHVSVPLASFGTANANPINLTEPAFSFGFGFYMSGQNNTDIQEIDIANVTLTMSTPPPLPPPTMAIVRAKPGLRIFAQSSVPTDQEGFGTQDPNQSWVGVATPANPVSYSITFADFDTVAGYTMNVQFAPGASPSDPYGVYNGNNDFLWTITSGGGTSGFTTAIGYKTNSPSNIRGGETNVVLATTATTCTNGRGTWTLTFTTDTNGTVTAPSGIVGSFVLDPNVPAEFANPVTILFGTSAAGGGLGGAGQFTDLSRLAISNVVDGTEFDDFTTDTSLNTGLWNPGFSVKAGSVIQVSTDTPYWVNWTLPDDQFGLGTKADLGNTNIPWSTPNYYGGGGTVISGPTQMYSLKWALIPSECMPTVDGTIGGTPSTKAFFGLLKPAPAQ